MTLVGTNQQDLFGTHGWLARQSDPETSRDAAEIVVAGLRDSQKNVLYVFEAVGRMSFEDLIYHAPRYGVFQSDSGLRTRTKELVVQGLVKDSGERRLTKSGRKCVMWEVVR